MAEEDGIEQIAGDRTAIEFEHRLFGAGAGGVDGVGDHFLADSAFAFDQHRNPGAGRFGGNRQRSAEGRGSADNFLKFQRHRDFLAERAQFTVVPGRFHCRIERLEHQFGGDRLDQIIGSTGANGVNGLGNRSDGGEHQHRQGGTARFQFGDQVGGFGTRHPMVEDDRIEHHSILCPEGRNRGFCVAGIDCAKSGPRSECGNQPALCRLIIDQQQ